METLQQECLVAKFQRTAPVPSKLALPRLDSDSLSQRFLRLPQQISVISSRENILFDCSLFDQFTELLQCWITVRTMTWKLKCGCQTDKKSKSEQGETPDKLDTTIDVFVGREGARGRERKGKGGREGRRQGKRGDKRETNGKRKHRGEE